MIEYLWGRVLCAFGNHIWYPYTTIDNEKRRLCSRPDCRRVEKLVPHEFELWEKQ